MKDKYPKERHNHPQFQQEKQDNCEGNSSLLNQNAILNSKSNIHNVSFDFIENCSKNAKERCFICDYCSKKCSKKTHLINHIRTHTKEKPYRCEFCSKAFSQKINLIVHIRTHAQERSYNCEYCFKSFSYKNILLYHIRTHTGEKPYKC